MNPTIFNNSNLETRFRITMEWGFSLNKFRISDMIYVRYAIHDFYALLILRASDNKLLELTGYAEETNEEDEDYFSKKDFFLNNAHILH